MARLKWYTTITNPNTGESKYIRAQTRRELHEKVSKQEAIWNERLAKRIAIQNIKDSKAQEAAYIAELKQIAANNSAEIESKISSYKSLLSQKSTIDFSIDACFDAMQRQDEFSTFFCNLKPPDIEKVRANLQVPAINKFREMLNSRLTDFRLSKEKEAAERFQLEKAKYEKTYQAEFALYNQRKSAFEQEKQAYNKEIDARRLAFKRGSTDEIIPLVTSVLSRLFYHPDFEEVLTDFECDYVISTKTLVISRKLPNIELLPSVRGFKYNASKRAIESVPWKKKELDSLFDTVVFQITLRTIRNMYQIMPPNVVSAVAFNGWIEYIDLSTGNETSACIISVATNRDEFEKINLEKVDPKECIKGLKGLFGTTLSNLTPVNPILNINRNDKRFINSKDVSEILIDGFNLATMEWVDFEHLIRQLFSRIFTFGNSEVKVTQSSRDNGVDAIAFDPDPIRGGKFVIQAKRYNILVPVAAVRELYGTMMNEHASRGILVTTSNFGKEAYEFAENKPITLINGQELLGLMKQNGFNNVTIKLDR